MSKKRKKTTNPLDKFKKAGTALLETNEFTFGNYTLLLKSIEKLKSDKSYNATIVFKHKKIIYSHMKIAKTKLEAVMCALEHVAMMGYGGIAEKDEDEKAEEEKTT